MHKLIILTAPSGAGKTTIVRRLLEVFPQLDFSISATTRAPRAYEQEGKDYYFLTTEEFKRRVAEGDFLEFEQVYENQFSGTLRQEIERLWRLGKTIIFDVDVHGAMSIKKAYPEHSLAIFVKPPSPEVLFDRLKKRNTESPENLAKRIAKTAEELTYENAFDRVLLNDSLDHAFIDAERMVRTFLDA